MHTYEELFLKIKVGKLLMSAARFESNPERSRRAVTYLQYTRKIFEIQ